MPRADDGDLAARAEVLDEGVVVRARDQDGLSRIAQGARDAVKETAEAGTRDQLRGINRCGKRDLGGVELGERGAEAERAGERVTLQEREARETLASVLKGAALRDVSGAWACVGKVLRDVRCPALVSTRVLAKGAGNEEQTRVWLEDEVLLEKHFEPVLHQALRSRWRATSQLPHGLRRTELLDSGRLILLTFSAKPRQTTPG